VLANADRVHDASAVRGAEAYDGPAVLPAECGSGPNHRACCSAEHLRQCSTGYNLGYNLGYGIKAARMWEERFRSVLNCIVFDCI
jgi:hypothetical protein